MRLFLRAFLLAALCAFSAKGHADEESKAVAESPEKPLLIFAAASLNEAFERASTAWADEIGAPKPRISVAASAVLARQITASAKADLFVSANIEWITYLKERQLLAGTPVVIARNRLVLALPRTDDSTQTVMQAPTSADSTRDLIAPHLQGRFALADPRTAPAGSYSVSALQAMELWESVQSGATYAGNARQTLALIERGGLPGFLYLSDVQTSEHAVAAVLLPESLHPEIQYVASVIARANNPAHAQDFLRWIAGPQGQKILVSFGFQPK